MWRAKISYRDPKKRNLPRKDLWVEKRTKEELEKEKSKYEAIEKNVIIVGTFGDLLDKWYKERLNFNKPKTLNEYREYLNYFINDEQLKMFMYLMLNISRSVRQLINLEADLREKDIRLKIIHENIDTNTSMGRDIFTILASIAEIESENTSLRTKSALKQAKKKGVKLGNK